MQQEHAGNIRDKIIRFRNRHYILVLIKIQTKQLDENLKVNLTLQSNKIYYFLAVLFSLAGVLFGLITYFSLANLCLAIIISIVFILIINLAFFIVTKGKFTDAKERFESVFISS